MRVSRRTSNVLTGVRRQVRRDRRRRVRRARLQSKAPRLGVAPAAQLSVIRRSARPARPAWRPGVLRTSLLAARPPFMSPDVRMVQQGEDLRLALEPLLQVGIGGDMLGEIR